HGGNVVYALCLIAQAEPFKVGHEEEPVLSVKHFWDLNRAAQRKAVLVPLERRGNGHRFGKAERARVQSVVSQELEDRAMVFVRAAFGRDIDLAHFAAELSRINSSSSFELL